jgi:hypothetical protein
MSNWPKQFVYEGYSIELNQMPRSGKWQVLGAPNIGADVRFDTEEEARQAAWDDVDRLSEPKIEELKKAVFALCEAEPDPERKAELDGLLESTWFGTPESLKEFLQQFRGESKTVEWLASEYVEMAL